MQKSPKSLLISYYLYTFVPGDEPLIKAGGSESGSSCVPSVASARGDDLRPFGSKRQRR